MTPRQAAREHPEVIAQPASEDGYQHDHGSKARTGVHTGPRAGVANTTASCLSFERIGYRVTGSNAIKSTGSVAG
jgi:hypothetical protein